MCGCNKTIAPAPITKISPVTYVPNPNCNYSEMDVYSIKFRLQCLERKIKTSVYNKHLGIINSLINLGVYCRYNLEATVALLEHHGC